VRPIDLAMNVEKSIVNIHLIWVQWANLKLIIIGCTCLFPILRYIFVTGVFYDVLVMANV
jgi:hypothetical protein